MPLLMTPLPHWRGGTVALAQGLCLRRLTPVERAAVEGSDALLLHHEIDAAARNAYWICHEFEGAPASEAVAYHRRRESAFKRILHAIYAVQIVVPVGAPNLYLLYRTTVNGGLAIDTTRHRPPLHGTIWARLCDTPPSTVAEIAPLLTRIDEVFHKPTLRLQIPVWLLEQGLTAPDRHIRLLLWATGLDGITRSGGMAIFAERLCGLLGADTSVFPAISTTPAPRYTVSDVAGDLYLLRNQMAHGLPFDPKFRKKPGLESESGDSVCPEFAHWRYDQVLEECSAFLLCRALRAILV
jgi:hypothetical protein